MSAAGAGASGGRRLGRGLESLLGPISREEAKAQGNLRELPVADVEPNPYQPRTHFDPAALQELVDSISASGLLQPVVVRERNGRYELIAGERRLRAVQQLGWKEIPAVIKEVDDQTLLTLALIENLQRHDLSPIDEATGYQRLQDEFKLPQTEVARLVGRNRSTVANLLRLLKLPDDVRTLVHTGALSEGHARALLALEMPSQISRLAQQAVTDGWSVRETEARVKNGGRAPATRTTSQKRVLATSTEARRVEDALRKRLGTDVTVTQKRKGRGLVSISYYSHDDLARLLELMLGEPFDG
ncbi:MAG TPA: ParB/RepB/Spo0J family partition protein [Gemmatimonadales bacterium]|nr:ParB/RepB/Spo0J family partition protein [Gemmatimonadales bacterium]